MEQNENDMYDDDGENVNTRRLCSWNEAQYTFVCFQQEEKYKL